MKTRLTILAAIFFAVSIVGAAEFQLRFAESVRKEPYSGRVYVFFSKDKQEPRLGPNWFRPEPFVAADVEDWKPGEPLTIDTEAAATLTFPRDFEKVDLEGMKAQAVARFNPWEQVTTRDPYLHRPATGPGQGYSATKVVETGGRNQLTIDQLGEGIDFKETDNIKLFEVRSDLLSEFHNRDVMLRAGVLLPRSYFNEPERRYPVIFEVPGFSGTHHDIHRRSNKESNALGVEFIRVMLDPSCPRGHNVFANSANNGPWGDALVNEFLPAFDQRFRTIAKPKARFLTGHSSGGWSSLWIMLTHPETFAGVWSTAPDPVDFRDFQRINLYREGENMFLDADDQRRPLARSNGKVLLWYRDFSDMEHVLGYGGQLHSFEAVFGQRTTEGVPTTLWNRETGEVDYAVAESWRPYDIRLRLEEIAKTNPDLLRDKIRIDMGTEDTFYLEGATELLSKSLAAKTLDMDINLIPDRDHMNLFQGGLREELEQEMAESFLSE